MIAKALRLADLVRHVRGASPNGAVVDILLERADHILAADGGRDCKRVLTDAEVDLLLAGDQPQRCGMRLIRPDLARGGVLGMSDPQQPDGPPLHHRATPRLCNLATRADGARPALSDHTRAHARSRRCAPGLSRLRLQELAQLCDEGVHGKRLGEHDGALGKL